MNELESPTQARMMLLRREATTALQQARAKPAARKVTTANPIPVVATTALQQARVKQNRSVPSVLDTIVLTPLAPLPSPTRPRTEAAESSQERNRSPSPWKPHRPWSSPSRAAAFVMPSSTLPPARVAAIDHLVLSSRIAKKPHLRKLSSLEFEVANLPSEQPITAKRRQRAHSVESPRKPAAVSSIPLIKLRAADMLERQAGATLPSRKSPDIPAELRLVWPPPKPAISALSPPTGTSDPVYPLACAACAGGVPYRWSKSRRSMHTVCDTCFLTNFATPRSFTNPLTPTGPSDSIWRHPLTSLATPSVNDARWSSVRISPSNPDFVLVFQGLRHLATLPTVQARYCRALFLASQYETSATFRVNEMDVVAFFVRIVIQCSLEQLPLPSSTSFRGDQHVFMSWPHLQEPGIWRPASLPRHTGPLHFADPSASAYTPVAQFKSPLNAEAHESLLAGHPHQAFLTNSIRVGFTLGAEPPVKAQPPIASSTVPASPELVQQEQLELSSGAVIKANSRDWWKIPLRFHPWFGVKRNGKTRGITHLTFGGTSSTNGSTSRVGIPKARLASWFAVANRINYMKAAYPGRKIVAAKLDARRAFRQCPIPIRDFWKTAQVFSGVRIVHVRLPFGATNSVDSMAQSISAVQDLAARAGIFVQSYVDDQFIIAYEDEIDSALAMIRRIWSDFGWELNTEKFESEGQPDSFKEFLGVQLDLANCTAAITPKRLAKIRELIASFNTSESVWSAKQLQSLAGTLNFVAAVIPFGRTFLSRLYSFAANPDPTLHDLVVLDLRWWQDVLLSFNGTASFAPPSAEQPVLHISTDAAKAGYGIVSPFTGEFAAGSWTAAELATSAINHREFGTMFLGADMFGEAVPGGFLVIHSDSKASVDTLTAAQAHEPIMINLLRAIVLLQLRNRFRVIPQFLPGHMNGLADMASRLHKLPPALAHFRQRKTPARTRANLGGILSSKSLMLPNPALSLATPPSPTSTNTANSSSTRPSPTLPWILWNAHQLVNPDTAVWSTSWSGYATPSCHTSQVKL